jgi:hypothetical protein
VLVSHYGRPLLVDFNMAAAGLAAAGDEAMFGGTLPSMAAEHLPPAQAGTDRGKNRPGDVTRAAGLRL